MAYKAKAKNERTHIRPAPPVAAASPQRHGLLPDVSIAGAAIRELLLSAKNCAHRTGIDRKCSTMERRATTSAPLPKADIM
jgi:hypothetical protein